jgi:hypothetical protein
MRAKSNYIRILRSWMDELGINGFLVFCGMWILMIVEGRCESIRTYLVRHRTVNIDVDSRGQPCKERLMTRLCNDEQETQRFSAFDVFDVALPKQVESLFSKFGLHSVYHDVVTQKLLPRSNHSI